MRLLVFGRYLLTRVRMIHNPHGLFSTRYERRPVGEDVLAGVVSFIFLYLLTIAVLSFALELVGLDMATSLSAALTAVANVGPGVGSIIGPAGNFAPLQDSAKLVLSLGMYLGRLEILTVCVLFTVAFWRDI